KSTSNWAASFALTRTNWMYPPTARAAAAAAVTIAVMSVTLVTVGFLLMLGWGKELRSGRAHGYPATDSPIRLVTIAGMGRAGWKIGGAARGRRGRVTELRSRFLDALGAVHHWRAAAGPSAEPRPRDPSRDPDSPLELHQQRPFRRRGGAKCNDLDEMMNR